MIYTTILNKNIKKNQKQQAGNKANKKFKFHSMFGNISGLLYCKSVLRLRTCN